MFISSFCVKNDNFSVIYTKFKSYGHLIRVNFKYYCVFITFEKCLHKKIEIKINNSIIKSEKYLHKEPLLLKEFFLQEKINEIELNHKIFDYLYIETIPLIFNMEKQIKI